MPVYEYHCVDCGARDRRVGGMDDWTAICAGCGGLLLRLDEDLFGPYFERATNSEEDDYHRNAENREIDSTNLAANKVAARICEEV
jgi:putative FmdB family regulatory protein